MSAVWERGEDEVSVVVEEEGDEASFEEEAYLNIIKKK